MMVAAAAATGTGSETVTNIAQYSNWRTRHIWQPSHSVWHVELGEHFNAMSINYVVDFQQHTLAHTT